jgi:hypothetical protein
MEIFDALFAPIARLLVARGVLFPELAERMKAHFVQAALAQTGGPPTDSRVSVLTGLQRRDVARLRGAVVRDQRPNHLSRLVAMWQTDPVWAKERLALPKTGPGATFETLAQAVRRDVHARTMLDALAAAGTVRLSSDGQTVHLVQGSYQPLAGSEDQIAYLARNLGDHAQAAVDNVQGEGPLHFERAVHYSGLTDAQVTELAARFAAAQMALLQDISQTAAAMKRSNQAPGAKRFRAGGYFFQTKDTE